MREYYGDLWNGRIVVITTNGFVKRNGACVMGRGCARQAVQRYPGIEFELGKALKLHGNHVINLGTMPDGKTIITFPVKPEFAIFNGYNAVKHMKANFRYGQKVPGWATTADLQLIKRSCFELKQLAINIVGDIYMPRPGCGAGELDWETQVKPILQSILTDDRFIICHK